ncbi:MAG: hypothetical protein K2X38_08855 [Gemmataceae bacterium]|nr:hypothetical protein [Gemmataceae bacterium]
MPRLFQMTWVQARKGWMKQHGGKMYSVSCRQLGTPATKMESWAAANTWWENTLASLEVAEAKTKSPEQDRASRIVLAALGAKELRDLEDLIRQGEAAKQMLLGLAAAYASPSPTPPSALGFSPMPSAMAEQAVENLRAGRSLPRKAVDQIVGFETEGLSEDSRLEVVAEAVAPVKGKRSHDPSQALSVHIQSWMASLMAEHAANGKPSATRIDSYKRHLAIFSNWFGSERAISEISAIVVKDYWTWLAGKAGEWSPSYSHSIFGAAKTFIRHLGELELISIPGNLSSKRLTFDVSASVNPIHFTTDEVKACLADPDKSERTELFFLLLVNCGMYQSDVADLLDSEVDWKAGRIIRYRSKTGKKGRKVSYLLWKRTFELLRKYRSGKETVLLSELGKPLVYQELKKDGSVKRCDLVQDPMGKVLRRLGIAKPLKALRKTSANLLEGNKDFAVFSDFLLAHSPKTTKERHYTNYSQPRFDEALRWLGKQFGVK